MTNILFKNVRIFHSQLKYNYLKNKKLFLNFSFHLWQLHQILNILKQNMMVVANIFQKLKTVKYFLWLLSKRSWFRTRFDSQHMKVAQILEKSPWERFYHVFYHSQGCWFGKCLKVLVVFVNRLTVDGRHPVQDSQNLRLTIQMQLSEKRRAVSQFLVAFLESTSNFNHFEKKRDCQS